MLLIKFCKKNNTQNIQGFKLHPCFLRMAIRALACPSSPEINQARMAPNAQRTDMTAAGSPFQHLSFPNTAHHTHPKATICRHLPIPTSSSSIRQGCGSLGGNVEQAGEPPSLLGVLVHLLLHAHQSPPSAPATQLVGQSVNQSAHQGERKGPKARAGCCCSAAAAA
jgi:hypothetical protein